MRDCKMFVRALLLVTGLCVFTVGSAQAQTVTVSPSSLSFGVPGTVTGVSSASQPISVTVTGSGSVTVSISPAGGSGDFAETDNCSGSVSAPGCVINVTFTPTPAGQANASATGLESATLTINNTQVLLTGALGAVPLFVNPVNVATSNGGASFNSPVTFGSQSLNLSCPAGGTAKISSSPDGTGNVVLDNYLILNSGPTPTSQAPFGNGAPAGNVCTGGVSDSNQQDCFTQAYRDAAGNFGANGLDPDNFATTWGVAPINVSSAFNGNVTATFNLLDEGVVLTSSRLFLVSKCTVAGVVPGGSVTGNPVDPANPKTQTQTSTFDNVGGQLGALTTDTSNSPGSVAKGTTQVTTDFAVPQQLFSQLVKGTSAAPAVCLRLNMEKDAANQPMCKAFLIQCWDPTGTTLSGDNCISTPSAVRNLFDATKYDSLDAPPGQNYLLSACSGVNSETCAQAVIGTTATTMLVGPGILLGGDQWLCPPGAGGDSSCTNQNNFDTTTSTSTAAYDPLNCVLTGSLTGDLCPLDTLTQFKGAADPVHGSTTSGKNSIFIPVTNVPLPFTQTTVTGRNANGWVRSTSVTASFVSNQANYIPVSGNPPANGFTPAPPYSLTYGFAEASVAAPDTTFPVSGDVSNPNVGTTALDSNKPLCAKTGVPNPFSSTTQSAFMADAGKFYNLHYFTTDCALTEELLFQPTNAQLSDPNANWASFRNVAFGVDNDSPTLSCTVPGPNAPNPANGWYATAPSASCTATDLTSGFAVSGQIQTAPNNGCDPNVYPDCVVKTGPKTWNFSIDPQNSGAATVIPSKTAYDLADNPTPAFAGATTPVDNTLPIITAKFNVSGTNFTFGQNVTAKFTCTDTGSGVATCGGQAVATCQMAPSANPLNYTSPSNVTIDTTSPTAVGSHTLYAVDCAGNTSTALTYTVSLGSVELAIANIPNPLASVKSGNNLTYKIFALNLSANTASNVVVTDTIPANTQYVSAMSGIVSCTFSGCNDLTTGSSCSVSGTGGPGSVVTCTTPTVKPILPGLTGYVIKLVVKVSAPASVKSISDTATVTSSNPDTNRNDNTVTVTTKVTQ